MRRSLRSLLLTLLMLACASPLFAGIAISVNFGPPPLPVYEQPLCPAAGYIWTPGYWAWDPDYGYYWVPGTWVLAPRVGVLWTPPWWGWENGAYFFHAGYWGPHVGFYGGINYGFGYFGMGFAGGRWNGDRFFYNRSVTNINVTNVRNVYNERVVNNTTVNRVSFNGPGGIQARPTPQELAAEHEEHIGPIREQTAHFEAARQNPQLRASFNQGKPPIAATERPGAFADRHVVPARAAGGTWHAPTTGPGSRPAYPGHARDLPQHSAVTPPGSGNAAADQRFQRDNQQLADRQNAEHQRLAQQQNREDQRAQQQQWNQQRMQQMEQRHQQQTQQMMDRHMAQTQHMQERQMGMRPGGGRPR